MYGTKFSPLPSSVFKHENLSVTDQCIQCIRILELFSAVHVQNLFRNHEMGFSRIRIFFYIHRKCCPIRDTRVTNVLHKPSAHQEIWINICFAHITVSMKLTCLPNICEIYIFKTISVLDLLILLLFPFSTLASLPLFGTCL